MSTAKERPIIFGGPMVRAILEGRKTQTRRVVRHPLAKASVRISSYKKQTEFDCILKDDSGGLIQCPYGAPGDRLWVRETWAPNTGANEGFLYRADHGDACLSVVGLDLEGRRLIYHVDRWRPSIHMPRWASRITLEITGIRVERLQQISEADAMAEGCPLVNPDPFIPGHGASSASGWFSDLWEQINGAGSWDANPWVWVVEFQRQEMAA